MSGTGTGVFTLACGEGVLNEKVLRIDWIGSKGSITSSYGLHSLFSLPSSLPSFLPPSLP